MATVGTRGDAGAPVRWPVRWSVIVPLAAALAATACTRASDLNQGTRLPERQATPTPAPLPPAPTGPVEAGSLRPAGSAAPEAPTPPPAPVAEAPTPSVSEVPGTGQDAQKKPEEVQVAVAQPQGQPVTKEGLIGAWTVSTGGKSCQMFLALTKWSGGFRAAQRGCSNTALSGVQAWNVSGRQVVLVDGSGSTVATLFKSADERYDGSATNGSAVSFSR